MKKPKAYLIPAELIDLIRMILHLQKTLINDTNDYYWIRLNNLNGLDFDRQREAENDLRQLFELKGMADGAICELNKIINNGIYTDDCR
jgi:hypothetical protein